MATIEDVQTDGIVGAVSHHKEHWHAIDWPTVYQEVRRLQVRIVKAQQEGKPGKVKALQHLLTHSFSGKALAVRRVTENQGSKTAGVDKVTWDTPLKKATAVHALQQHGYHPQPLRRVSIPKKNGKMRPLGIPTMKDRAMQALYLLALDPIAETTADPNSYGFRPERSCADALEQCYILLAKTRDPQWILEGDIKACFDRISHDWLLANAPMDKGILRKWLKAGYIDKHTLHPTEEGTPQGGICSPVLANLTLDGLERVLREHFRDTTRASRKARSKVHLVRYADDFIVTGSSKELLENEVKPLVEAFMRERGLELSQEKTHITHIEEGFDFLGQNVRKYNGKLLIKPSKKSVKAHLESIRGRIKDNPTDTAGHLITLLNPVIRGWANYHRHAISSEIFHKVDYAIFKALWRWAKRRHPNKGKKWIRKKYFQTVGTRNWVFVGEIIGKQGVKRVELASAGKTPIQRHNKIRGEANPYDPQWETYFDERMGLKWLQGGMKRRKLIVLWNEQEGRCPLCNQKITKETGWNVHHILYRVYGGKDTLSNLLLLHPNCHRQVHSQKLDVVKPRPTRGGRKA